MQMELDMAARASSSSARGQRWGIVSSGQPGLCSGGGRRGMD